MAQEINLNEAQVGDLAYIDGDSGFCDGHYRQITAITTKYNEDTGEPYGVIKCGSSTYRASDGSTITGAKAYSIFFVYRISDEERKEFKRCERTGEYFRLTVKPEPVKPKPVKPEPVNNEIKKQLTALYPNAKIL